MPRPRPVPFEALQDLRNTLKKEQQAQQTRLAAEREQATAQATQRALARAELHAALGVQTKTEPLDPATQQQLFQSAMQGVKPLPKPAKAPQLTQRPRKPDAQLLAKRAAAVGIETAGLQHAISDTQALLKPVASEAVLSFKQTTLQNRLFEQLKQGDMRWRLAADLHGCTVEQAREAVLELIQIAQQDNQNIVKIVHGKGQDSTLKTYVNGWLRQHPEVLGFHSAPTNQGGTGAVLVLLKRPDAPNMR